MEMATNTPTLNVPLLRKMVEWVEEQETLTEGREWLQTTWFTSSYDVEGFCNTAYCVAGKIALDAGWEPTRVMDSWDQPMDGWVTKGDELRTVSSVAAGLLGLSDLEGLFHGENTAADIRRIAEEIAGERL